MNDFSVSLSRTAVDRYGVWDQVRIDHGREFYLLIYIQEQLRKDYGARDVLPYVQSRSTEVRAFKGSLQVQMYHVSLCYGVVTLLAVLHSQATCPH